MTIHELLEKFKPSEVSVQFLDECVQFANSRRKGKSTLVSFETNAMSPSDLITKSGKVGVVMWFNRDQWRERLLEGKQ